MPERLVFIVLILILLFVPSLLSQECPEIYVPPYGAKPRECERSIGSTCLITCPDEFEITGNCFRTCIVTDETTQLLDDNADLKANSKKRITRPFLFGLKPKRLSFLPASPINKRIRSGKGATCCNKTKREPREEITELVRAGEAKSENYRDSEMCPGESLPEHHLLQTIAKTMRDQEVQISGRQNTPHWSGTQPYCVNIEVQCVELSPPRNGFFYYCYNYAGLSCAIACHDGYRLMGSRILLCDRQGNWSDDLPTCQQI